MLEKTANTQSRVRKHFASYINLERGSTRLKPGVELPKADDTEPSKSMWWTSSLLKLLQE